MVVSLLSRVQFLVIPWAIAQQAHLSMRFSRQEHWSGLPFSSPGVLPHPRIEPTSPALQAGSLPSEPPGYYKGTTTTPAKKKKDRWVATFTAMPQGQAWRTHILATQQRAGLGRRRGRVRKKAEAARTSAAKADFCNMPDSIARVVCTLSHLIPRRTLWANSTVIPLPGVMYGCENWTTKKAECRRSDAFQLWCWGRILRVPWTAGRSNQSILKKISPEYSLEGLMLKLQYFGHLM